ncbi:TrmH family RNA methyltransferase [Tenacibaculum sp. UWU-22]|uniref:TrmH family RNA methyltransferase n=1 Tax=Tenacibaculum sp. UWU-22 TaxID=3234187 RepID=UPI0034DB51F2
MKQLTHYDIENKKQTFPITIVCDAIRTPENIGMCFRVAESFGVAKIYIHNNSPSTENRIVKKTARNTIEQVPHERYNDFQQLIKNLKKEGNTIIGIEITDKSTPIKDYDFKTHSKIVLLLGNERKGIENIDLIDAAIAIPMYGRNSSMNVIHSLAIALYETTNQIKVTELRVKSQE